MSKRLYSKATSATNPGSYNEEIHPEKVFRMRLLGLTHIEIADLFGIGGAMLSRWLDMYPVFKMAYDAGAKEADAQVTKSLFQRAIGYSHKETKVFLYKGEIVKENITKHYPPETAAAIFWLKNRTKDNENPWSDLTKHEITGLKEGAIQLEDLTKTDLSNF